MPPISLLPFDSITFLNYQHLLPLQQDANVMNTLFPPRPEAMAAIASGMPMPLLPDLRNSCGGRVSLWQQEQARQQEQALLFPMRSRQPILLRPAASLTTSAAAVPVAPQNRSRLARSTATFQQQRMPVQVLPAALPVSLPPEPPPSMASPGNNSLLGPLSSDHEMPPQGFFSSVFEEDAGCDEKEAMGDRRMGQSEDGTMFEDTWF